MSDVIQSIPGFRLTELLGSGAASDVYLAKESPDEAEPLLDAEPVAIKILKHAVKKEKNELAIRSFSQETRALRQLDHPNIIRYFASGIDTLDRPFLIMERLGVGHTLERDLKAAFDEQQGLPVQQVRMIAGQVLSALEAAHELHIVHRDVKPSNIMIIDDEGEPQVKLLDFGLAKFTDDEAGTRTRNFAGTLAYAAPEQTQGHSIRPWTDLYAVAEITLEMLTARSLFGGLKTVELHRLKLGLSQPVRKTVEGAVAGYDWPEEALIFFTRALSAVPQKRYETAAELRAALMPVLDVLQAGTEQGRYGKGCDTFSLTLALKSRLPPAPPRPAPAPAPPQPAPPQPAAPQPAPAVVSPAAPSPAAPPQAAQTPQRAPAQGSSAWRTGLKAALAVVLLVGCALGARWVVSREPSVARPAGGTGGAEPMQAAAMVDVALAPLPGPASTPAVGVDPEANDPPPVEAAEPVAPLVEPVAAAAAVAPPPEAAAGPAAVKGGTPEEPFLMWSPEPWSTPTAEIVRKGWSSLPMFLKPELQARLAPPMPGIAEFVKAGKGKYDVSLGSIDRCRVLTVKDTFAEVVCRLTSPPQAWGDGPWAIQAWTRTAALQDEALP